VIQKKFTISVKVNGDIVELSPDSVKVGRYKAFVVGEDGYNCIDIRESWGFNWVCNPGSWPINPLSTKLYTDSFVFVPIMDTEELYAITQ
jgi:hypothetical protein